MDKDKAIKEQQMRAAINAKLIETGEREKYAHIQFFLLKLFII